MNYSFWVFMFMWVGMPVIWLALTIVFFILWRKARKKKIAEPVPGNIKKARVFKVFFIIFLVMFIISAILSGGLLILLSMAAKHM